jgi:tetratricopeptide (TPR) repeat protein
VRRNKFKEHCFQKFYPALHHISSIMKTILFVISLFLFTLVVTASSAQAQAEASAAWQVQRYDINVSAQPADRALTARAQLAIRNVGRGTSNRITLRINPKAEIKNAFVNDATASFRPSTDTRTNLLRVEISLPAQIAPGNTFNVAVEYRLPVEQNSGLAAISPLGAQFLPQMESPLSLWYPTPGNPLSPRGADTAPFRLKVTTGAGETVISSGKSNAGTFEQTLSGQPFFLSGNWDVSEGATAESRGISAYLPKGASAEERKQAEAIIALAGTARAFYAGMLGAAPDAPVRIVVVTRGAGFNNSGTLLLNAAAFRRAKVDAVTAMQVAETVARLWIGGGVAVRGEGSGVVQEGLGRYLATLFLEKHFGSEMAEAERLRQRTAHAAVARRDAPLALTTPLDASYFNAVGNKGAMVWRLAERTLGRDALMETLRTHLQTRAGDGGGMTLASLREALGARGGDSVRNLLQYELDQPTDTDLMVGMPQLRGSEWVVALRNLGGLDVSTSVVAITESGERLKTEVTVPARNFADAIFKTAVKLKRVEIDPEKIYPQFDYGNDFAPRSTSNEEPLTEAARLFSRQDYAKAEALLRGFLMAAPHAEEARVLLARSLLAQNRADQAEKEFRAALELRAPTPATLAWANVGLGEISLQRGQAAQAARHFDEAVRADAEYAATLAARAGRIKAEAAAKTASAPDESARAFLAQLDKSILSGRKAEVEAMLVPGELADFAKGIVGAQPEIWQTQVLRTEQLDAARLAADVSLNVKQLGGEQSGTAVLILARVGGSWKLAGIEFFEVR